MKFRATAILTILCLFGLYTVNAQTFAVSTTPAENTRLTKFSGVKKENIISLNWSTASEQTSSHFIVERSADGLNFDSIGAVTALGRFHVATAYTFQDLEPKPGHQYYRLKIVDLDGRTDSGKILKVGAEAKL